MRNNQSRQGKPTKKKGISKATRSYYAVAGALALGLLLALGLGTVVVYEDTVNRCTYNKDLDVTVSTAIGGGDSYSVRTIFGVDEYVAKKTADNRCVKVEGATLFNLDKLISSTMNW